MKIEVGDKVKFNDSAIRCSINPERKAKYVFEVVRKGFISDHFTQSCEVILYTTTGMYLRVSNVKKVDKKTPVYEPEPII